MKEDSIQDKEFGDVDLTKTLSTTYLSDKKTAAKEDLTADKLLDELPLPQHEQSLYMNGASALTSGNTYDQFFEEVSLDLPRDDTHPISRSESQSPSRLMKFMPRRGNSLPGSTVNLNTNNTKSNSSSNNNKSNGHHAADSNMTITTSDISGPFYSISDVLDDTASAAAIAAANRVRASGEFESVDMNLNPRAARRNVNEAEVVVTSGGTSIPVKRRTS
jgi:hypothetical protein